MMTPVVITLSGDSGSGKTTMAQFLAHHIRGDGFVALVLQFGETLAAVNTMKAMSDIIAQLPNEVVARLVIIVDGVWSENDMRKIVVDYPYAYSLLLTYGVKQAHGRTQRIPDTMFDKKISVDDSTTFAAQAYKAWHAAQLQAG